jgi:hypothetical protein
MIGAGYDVSGAGHACVDAAPGVESLSVAEFRDDRVRFAIERSLEIMSETSRYFPNGMKENEKDMLGRNWPTSTIGCASVPPSRSRQPLGCRRQREPARRFVEQVIQNEKK